MSELFDKLNLRNDNEIFVPAAPASFEPELAEPAGVNLIRDAAHVP